MILSVQRQIRTPSVTGSARSSASPTCRRFPSKCRRRARSRPGGPGGLQLARTLAGAPGDRSRTGAGALGVIPGVARILATPNGYLNLFLERPAFFTARASAIAAEPAAVEKTIVEHTAINPNKAAHIGHLRNAALGDTLVRALRFRGTPVETQNYIDDTGVQVADVIVGFKEIEHRTIDEVRTIADTSRFDYHCWDLYSKVTEWYDGDKARLAIRAAVLHDLEQGGNETAAMGTFIVDRIVRAHLQTMARLNIGYDLLTYEGDILRLHFWTHAFETLKAQGAVFLQTEGKLAGCWVMRIEEEGGVGVGAELAQPDDGDEAREKVIVRSNGVVTYIGKDLANQFWKFGLLGLDFHYRLLTPRSPTDGRSGRRRPERTSLALRRSATRSCIYNVIDSRQMYLQALLSQALRTLGHPTEAEHSIHFS
jgi:arginyl-tRNA synthetase